MKNQIKRKQQILDINEIKEVLNNNTSGVLCLLDENNNPYGVPLNYAYVNDKIIFHTSKFGYKMDLIKNNSKCSFTIIDQDKIVEEDYTSLFKSVIVQGNIRIVKDTTEIINYMNLFTDKYVSFKEEREDIIKRNLSNLSILELTIEQISGKCALGLRMIK